MFNIMKLDVPSYPESRCFLDDPTSTSIILNDYVALESEIITERNIMETEDAMSRLGFESVDISVIESRLGLEGSITETVKRSFYTLKKRAGQLIKYIVGFFLKLFAGTNDVKGVLTKYSKKVKSNLKAFEKLTVNTSGEKKLEIRDVTKTVLYPIIMIHVVSANMDLVANYIGNKILKSTDPKGTTIFNLAGTLQSVTNSVIDFGDKVLKGDVSVDQLATTFSNEEVEKNVKNFIVKWVDKLLHSPEEAVSLQKDNLGKLNALVESFADLFKDDLPTIELDYAEAYKYMLNALRALNDTLENKVAKWDFVKITKKLNNLQPKLMKMISELSADENAKYDKEISVVMELGAQFSKMTKIVNLSLKNFKKNCEVLITESSKVGSAIYHKS